MVAQNLISRIGEPGRMPEFKADAQAARPGPQEIFERCRSDSERAWQLKQHWSEAISILERAQCQSELADPGFRVSQAVAVEMADWLGPAKRKEKMVWSLRQPAVGHVTAEYVAATKRVVHLNRVKLGGVKAQESARRQIGGVELGFPQRIRPS